MPEDQEAEKPLPEGTQPKDEPKYDPKVDPQLPSSNAQIYEKKVDEDLKSRNLRK